MILFALISLLSASRLSSCADSVLMDSRRQQWLCIWRCNAANRSQLRQTTNHEEVESFRSCYKDCQKKKSKRDKLAFDVQNTSDSADGKSIMLTVRRRVRRSWPLGPGCPNNTKNVTDLKYPNVTVSFHKYTNSVDWYANVSWTPITNAAVNWTGYLLRYNIGRHHGKRNYSCKVFSKNQTNVIMNPKMEGWKDPYEPIYVQVSALPFNKVSVYTKEIQAPAGFFPITTTSPDFLLTTTTTTSGNKTAIYISTIFGTLAALALFAYLFRRFSQFTKRKLQTTQWVPDLKPIPEGFKYHAFIIYSSKDAKWVSGTLLRTLECENGFRCCVHYRDFVPGVPFRDNMVNSIYNSCKIIAVISKNFFESPFCDFELQTALYRLLENRDDSVVIIRRDKVNSKKLPQELRFRSFIDYSNTLDRKSWESKVVRFLESSRDVSCL